MVLEVYHIESEDGTALQPVHIRNDDLNFIFGQLVQVQVVEGFLLQFQRRQGHKVFLPDALKIFDVVFDFLFSLGAGFEVFLVAAFLESFGVLVVFFGLVLEEFDVFADFYHRGMDTFVE